MKKRLQQFALKLLGLDSHDWRIKDLERHFVTRRDPESGRPVETLADLSQEQRKERRTRLAGMTIDQRKRWMEATDGGRNLG